MQKSQLHTHDHGLSGPFFFCHMCVQEDILEDAGWRGFTTIEVPEFEGFSSGKLPGRIALHGRTARHRTFKLEPFSCRCRPPLLPQINDTIASPW